MNRSCRDNVLLRSLLSETSWTQEACARAVNVTAAEAGLELYLDRRSVGHWLAGVRPRRPIPELAAEALSRRLGRVVTVEETGLCQSAADPAEHEWLRQDPIETLTALATAGSRRGSQIKGAYSLAALAVPGWEQVVGDRLGSRSPDSGAAPLSRDEVSAVRSVLAVFARADASFGGGYVRFAASRYLAATVPRLRAPGPATVRNDLAITAARLAYLAGYASFDEADHPAAQRYHLAALRLSGRAGDKIGYAMSLRALSVQAQELGHLDHAVSLAEAADAAAGTADYQSRAFFGSQLAVARAQAGDHRGAAALLKSAEEYLSRADSAPRAIGGCHPAALHHARARILAAAGDLPGAISALEASLRHRPADERRARAVTTARLAELQLDSGHLEAACATWHRLLTDVPYLTSGRIEAAVATLNARTRPYQKVPVVRALRERMSELRLAHKRRR